MTKEKTIQSEIGGYISSLLRDHFGKGPTSVFVTIERPFILIHIRGFLAPTEKILLKQQDTKRILEIRDLLMNELRPEIKLQLWKLAELDVKELYADWNIDKQTGVLLGILQDESKKEALEWPKSIDHETVRRQIIHASTFVQKTPEETEVFWLNDRSFLSIRSVILVEIEKELIKNGFTEELKIAKRPVERRMFKQSGLESVLNQKIADVFVDWDFEGDRGFTVFVLEPRKS